MQGARSPNDPKIKQLNRLIWKDRLLSGSNRTLCGNIFRLGLVVTWLSLPFLHWGYLVHTEKYGERSSVIATVDEWSKSYGGGHGGGVGGYSIKVTLPDGTKASASAIPLGPDPPKSGEKIQLVKIVSVLGFTSYRWERPYWTWDDGTLRANKLLW
jgi:hypothetical protein